MDLFFFLPVYYQKFQNIQESKEIGYTWDQFPVWKLMYEISTQVETF